MVETIIMIIHIKIFPYFINEFQYRNLTYEKFKKII